MKTKYQFIALAFLMLPSAITAQPSLTRKTTATAAKPLNLSAMLDNNQLFISGNFESDKRYEVLMFDAHGYKIYSKSFSGEETEQRFSINEKLNDGKYKVAVRLQQNDHPLQSISML